MQKEEILIEGIRVIFDFDKLEHRFVPEPDLDTMFIIQNISCYMIF